MGNRHHSSIEQAKRKKANLAIIEAIIQESKRRLISEDLFDSEKVEPVAIEIRSPLCFIPFEPHKQCSYNL